MPKKIMLQCDADQLVLGTPIPLTESAIDNVI